MRQTVGFLLLGLLASVPLGATPQKLKSSASSKMTAVQDPAAVAVLSQAITAMGGQPSSGPITTVQITGTATIAGDNNRTAITATFLYETTSTGYEFRRETQSGANDAIFVSGYGSPAHSTNGVVDSFPSYVSAAIGPTQMPLMVFTQAISNSSFSISMQSPSPIGGVNAVHVQIANTTDTTNQSYTVEDWFFDPNTGLPLEVRCVAPDVNNPLNNSVGTEDFANYQNVGGVLAPFQITDSVDGSVVATTTVSSVSINLPVDPSQFNLDQTHAGARR